ncbi:MAG: DNA mismatch repair protein MutS [Leptospirales bacterium]|nr:DNA mismatch repair protein MutS [Leptospirales bacterium]
MNPKITPMLKQYTEFKESQKDAILFFRMGDFYEMFFEDAQVASKILSITLTSRQNDVPMCGVPYHSADNYIARLIRAGKRVAVCEQLETAPLPGHAIVRREIVRVITPGTVIESNILGSDDNNFLAAAVFDGTVMGLAFVDISTGDFYISSMEKSAHLFRCEMTRFNPPEIVMNYKEDDSDDEFFDYVEKRGISIYHINRWLYDADYMRKTICDVFQTATTKGLGLTEDIDIVTAGSIIQYLKETQRKAFEHLKPPRRLLSSDIMLLDEATITNLELVHNQQDNTRSGTLLSVLNHTKTAMGKRFLEMNILQPLLSKSEIEKRLFAVNRINSDSYLSASLVELLDGIYDVERLISRFALGKLITKNFIALAESVSRSMNIKKALASHLPELSESIPDCADLAEKIRTMITDNPAVSPEQGRVIREGFDAELDRLYSLRTNSKEWMLEYQEEEKQRTGLSTLKVRYNKIIGYYIEISKTQAANAPKEYFRKQTLVGGERFTTERLGEFEREVASVSYKIIELETVFVNELCLEVSRRRPELQAMAESIALADFYVSLALSAAENRFVMPSFNEEGLTVIKDGRHPVVEKYYTEDVFVPNDIFFDDTDNIIQIITGPNMSGKSTYIRMSGIIQLMAQIGSFVPAKEASLSIVDRIFTRVGASDNISRGESTFLVEMNETANIVNNATDKSLIIMDEVGRGTSTYDGLSIAWAVIEHILRSIKAKTMFATHYHELTALGKKQGIVNYTITVKETMKGVDFLHKVAPGSSGKSYGIHVARLAGLPAGIITRAHNILDKLEKNSSRQNRNDTEPPAAPPSEQLEIFNSMNHIIVQAIEKIDCDSITPLDALNELNRLKRLLK